MSKYFRIALLAALVIPLAWFGISRIDAQSPGRGTTSDWDAASALSYFQPPPGGGRGGPDGRRGDGPRDGRRPPPPGPDGRPPRGGPGGPPPGPEGRPPRPGSGGKLEMEYLKQIDPEMAELIEADHELDRETYRLADAYRRAEGASKTQFRNEIVDVIKRHFEIRQQRRELELKRLEEELARLKESIDTRNEAKDEIVERRIDEVLEEGELGF